MIYRNESLAYVPVMELESDTAGESGFVCKVVSNNAYNGKFVNVWVNEKNEVLGTSSGCFDEVGKAYQDHVNFLARKRS